jgi:hypothetical protein
MLPRARTWKIPAFRGEVPSVFDDVTYFRNQQKLLVANRTGMGEFPLRGGEVVFDPPGFTAPCAGSEIRAFAPAKGKHTAALIWNRRIISVTTGRRSAVNYTIPSCIRDATGLAFDGEQYFVADRLSNVVYRVKLDESKRSAVISSRTHCEGKGVVGVAFDAQRLWITDGSGLFIHDPPGRVLARFHLPHEVSGIAVADDFIWATAKGKPYLYRWEVPQLVKAG